MMKMGMRLDKSQVKSLYKYTTPGEVAASARIQRNLCIMAGYKNYDAILVGGAGGQSGWTESILPNGAGYQMSECGGGGGGTLRLQGKLKDLPGPTQGGAPGFSISVGWAGANGAYNGLDSKAGDGQQGGSSYFNGHYGGGGAGGIGGDYTSTTQPAFTVDVTTRAKGGQGGGNSAGLGSGGAGGDCYLYEVINAGVNEAGATSPGWGHYAAGGAYPVVGGGRGGGGGPGRVRGPGGAYKDQPRGGALGNEGVFQSGGAPAGVAAGGCGGGANLLPVTGVNEWYGQSNGTSAAGAVAVKLS